MNGPSIDESSRKTYEEYEREHWNLLQQCINMAGLELSDIMKNFPAFVRRRELAKFIGHYELFKKIINVPGSIVELGVFLGAGFFTWSKLLETFLPGDRGRLVYGFESFQGYQSFSEKDGEAKPWSDRLIGQLKPMEEYISGMNELHHNDNFLRGVKRCKIIKGDICETVVEFSNRSLGTRLSLLYFDVNLYKPTLSGLEHLYPLVIPGGIVAFNAYGSPPWEGEGRAIEDYFSSIGEPIPIMSKFEFSMYPSAYFIKKG